MGRRNQRFLARMGAGGDINRTIPDLVDLWRYKLTIARSGLIGTPVGIIPGVGEDIGAWASYAAARKTSKEKEKFGHGSHEGLIAAETGNSAVVPGSLIPAITLAVPGSASSAVLIAALFIHGIRPGPLIMIEQPDFIGLISAMVVIATLFMAFYGLTLTKAFVQVLKVPYAYLMPVVFVLCVIGTFALSQRIFDIWIMVFFGLVGFVLRQMKYPMAPLVLGIILGDLLDKSLRRGLTLSDGELAPFFTRPVSAWFVALILLSMAAAGSTNGADAAAKVMELANAPGEKVYAGELAKAIELIAAGTDIDYVGASSVELIEPGEASGGYAEMEMKNGKLEVRKTPNAETPLTEAGATPLLTMDVWEHAYYLNYQNRRPDYISAWWNLVNWDVVSANYSDAVG